MPKKAGKKTLHSAPPAAPAALRGDARERIMEVAGAMLRDVGPDGLRLQEIAKAVGVSHPAILHHFGSREGLVRAVVERALINIESDVARAISVDHDEMDAGAILESCFRALSEQGHGRLIAWLALSDRGEERMLTKLGDIAWLVHGVRKTRLEASGQKAPSFEDSAFVVMLATFALLGDAICGDAVREATPLGKKDRTGERFRRWLAERLVTHLETPRTPDD